MTTTIHGRTRYSDTASTVIEVRRHGGHGEPLFVIEGALIETRTHNSGFTISAKHPTATDREHDSSYVALFEGGGLNFDSMMPESMTFTGVLLSARYWPTPDPVAGFSNERCEEDWCQTKGHPILPFQPPPGEIAPGIYHLTVRYRAGATVDPEPKDALR